MRTLEPRTSKKPGRETRGYDGNEMVMAAVRSRGFASRGDITKSGLLAIHQVDTTFGFR